MYPRYRLSALTALACFTISGSSLAMTLKGKLPAGGYELLSIADSGNQATAKTGSALQAFELTRVTGADRLYLLKNGEMAGPVVLAVKSGGKYYTLAKALNSTRKIGKTKVRICADPTAQLVLGMKGLTSGNTKVNLGTVSVNAEEGIAYVQTLPTTKYLNAATLTAIADTASCAPEGSGASLGLSSGSGGQRPTAAGWVAGGPTSTDSDGDGDSDEDGLIDALDIDADNDGVLNAYDDSTPTTGTSEFRVFSNLKLDIGQSLNHYVFSSLTETDFTRAAGQVGLAMQVSGGSAATVELDCLGLSYCSSGGTGTYNGSMFPDNYDSDADGYGTLTIGPTGDFQLRPNVLSWAAIGAGDTYIQYVDKAGTVTKVTGMLNFVFNTTPALQRIVMGATTNDVSYPTTPAFTNNAQGSMNAPFVAPSGWDGTLTVTAYRPQRRGIPAAGEGTWVDIGHSLITIDIPNGPGNSGAGPGNCDATSYSTTDSQLATDPNGLKDQRDDQDTDTANPSSNTVTFTVNLTTCLGGTWSSWSAGQTLGIDLQFRNQYGDNAAQKFYIQKS